MTNEEILIKYRDWKSIKNDRASVVYKWTITKFLEHCGKPIHKIDIDDVIGFQAELKADKSEATCANNAAALRSFFRFTNKRGITAIDVEDISTPKVHEKVPVYVAQSEFQILCDIAKFIHPHIHLAVRLLWFTAVRVSELCDLAIDNIDLEQKCGVVSTRKAYKPKRVFWDDETNDLIAGAMKTHPERIYLFESPRGGKISTRQVERWIADIVKKSGIDRHITPHSFRHGATKEWLNNGMDLPIIKDLLGHTSLMSIENYTRRLDDDIKEKGREAVMQRVNSIRFNLAHRRKGDKSKVLIKH